MLVFVCFLTSCDDESEDCPKSLPCTRELQIINIKVTSNGESVTLEYYKTVNLSNNEIYNYQYLSYYEPGVYPVLTDAEFDKVDKNGSSFRFEGSIMDAVVVDEIFVIGHDCCHIELIDGNIEVEIQ